MRGSLDTLAEITSPLSNGLSRQKKEQAQPKLHTLTHFPVSIPAVSAGCSSRNCSADIAGLKRGNGAHKTRQL